MTNMRKLLIAALVVYLCLSILLMLLGLSFELAFSIPLVLLFGLVRWKYFIELTSEHDARLRARRSKKRPKKN